MVSVQTYRMDTIKEAVEKGFEVLLHMTDAFLKFSAARRHPKEGDVMDGYYLTMGNTLYARLNSVEPHMLKEYNSTINLIHKQIRLKTLKEMLLVHSEFSKCDKNIFVGHRGELDAFARKILQKSPNIGVYYGTDEFLPTQLYVTLEPLDWDKSNIIRRRFQSLVHSGLLLRQLTEPTEIPVALQERLHLSMRTALRLSSNVIVSIFVIVGALLSLSLIIYCFELCLPTYCIAW